MFAQRTQPKTFNPVVAGDQASREVIHRLTGDLIHINRATLKVEPGLAKSWTVTPDGRRYVLELRCGVRFSDGHPFDADDVLFSFQVYLDEKTGSAQRDLLILEGKPIVVRKLDACTVAFDLAQPYAAAERLFDGFAILPRHLLGRAYQEGKLAEAWNLRTPRAEMAGLGPFRLKEAVPGQHITLERNPYYWKTDAEGRKLPYLNEITFAFAGGEEGQILRFQAGESDQISRLSAKNFAHLEKRQAGKGYRLVDLGPGLEHTFLFFNLNTASRGTLPRQVPFHRRSFRQAVSAAVDREAICRLVYLGHATPLAAPVSPGNRAWVNQRIPRPARSLDRARALLAADGFTWAAGGGLLDPRGRPVEFSILTSAGNPERVQMATIIQDDLARLGMRVHVTPVEFRSLLDRVQKTREYEACLLSLGSGDADPNADMNVWLSSGASHLWNPGQKSPGSAWEAEIDALMRRQLVTRGYAGRKRLYDRVQELLAENLPLIPLVSPNILVGAKTNLGNFRPAILDHYTLWNAEELFWR
ncbi:MAG: ABC transporter substrate-binding protein [Acidobacteria bacterium]|nr:ABC transporter substrate-binding protein [Acidobacteriota bacterium]